MGRNLYLEMMMKTFSVPGMSCGHCTASIEEGILEVDEGAEVSCDLDAKTVEVDSILSGADILEAIKSAGFEASPV